MRAKLAEGYASLEQWGRAVETMELAMNALADAASHRPLTSKESDSRNSGAAKLALWKSQAGARK